MNAAALPTPTRKDGWPPTANGALQPESPPKPVEPPSGTLPKPIEPSSGPPPKPVEPLPKPPPKPIESPPKPPPQPIEFRHGPLPKPIEPAPKPLPKLIEPLPDPPKPVEPLPKPPPEPLSKTIEPSLKLRPEPLPKPIEPSIKPLPKLLPKAIEPQSELLIEPVLGDTPDIRPSLVLPAEITHAQAASCLNMLLTTERAEGPEQTTVMVDATPLARFDSSALAVLIECRRAALRRNKGFTVRGMPARLAELARLYGVAELLGVENSAPARPAVASSYPAQPGLTN